MRKDTESTKNLKDQEKQQNMDKHHKNLSEANKEMSEADKKAAMEAAANKPIMPVNEKWFTFWYWKPLVLSCAFVVLMIEIVGGYVWDRFVTFTLVSESLLISFTLFGFGMVVY